MTIQKDTVFDYLKMFMPCWLNWKGRIVRKGDVETAKIYLDEYEIEILNRIVVMWLDTAELRMLLP